MDKYPGIAQASLSSASFATGLTDPLAQAGVQAAMDALQPVNLLEVAFPNTTTRSQIRAGTVATDCLAVIRTTIDTQLAAGRVVFYLSDGVYLGNGTRVGVANSQLYVRGNMALFGAPGAIIKLVNGYTAGGDYSIMASEANSDTSNVIIDGLTFDGNSANNLVTIGQTRGCYSIKIFQGSHIRVRNCRFLNNPGRNVVICGNNSLVPSCSDVVISDNYVYNVGPAVAGNVQNDHSSFYMQCDGCLVTRNRMENPSVVDPSLTVVAFEIHGRNTKIIGNTIVNFTYGGNSVAQVHDSEHQLWSHNHFTVSKSGWSFFSLNYVLRDVQFVHNIIVLDFGAYQPAGMIYQGRGLNVATQPEKIVIEDNTLYCAIATPLSHSWSGIDIVCCSGLTIRRNSIVNVQCSGVDLNTLNSNSNLGFDKVIIEDNDIENCGLHVAANNVWGIRIRNSGATVTISIASPGVVTWPSHPFNVGDEFQATTTGALPTGLTASTTYFVQSVIDANSITLSATFGGSVVNTSGTQSGVHTGIASSRWFQEEVIDNNRINKPTPAGVGNMRGTRIEGPAPIIRSRYKGTNETRGIALALRYSTLSTTLFREVIREPRIVWADHNINGANPVRGFFEGAGEQVWSANPISATKLVRRVGTDGAAYGAVRADSAAVQKGDCIKDSGTVVYECQRSGVLGTGNPTAPGVGGTVTDGTVPLLELCATAAAFADGYGFP